MIARKVNKGGKLMSRKRRRFSSEFKTQVVLELLLEQKTVAELCSKYEISSQTINDWKHEFLSNASLAFDKTKVVKEYKEQIEKLTKEKEVLSKKLAQEVIEKEWLAGKLKSLDLSIRRNLIDKREGVQANRVNPSLNRQLRLLGIYKGTYYYKNLEPYSNAKDNEMLREIEKIYLVNPTYGYRRIKAELNRSGYAIGKKKVVSMMGYLGIRAVYPKKRFIYNNQIQNRHPYLLDEFKDDKGKIILSKSNTVWSADITYIKLEKGHAYLAAILDWYSRKVLSWRLSNTMDTELVVSVTKSALEKYGRPQIFNSDLGSQYTSHEHIKLLSDNNIKISMNGKGRSIDNISIERFFRTVKYEEVLLKSYSDIRDARCSLDNYINRYNKFRLHSSLGYRTPDEVYFQGMLKEDTLLSETA